MSGIEALKVKAAEIKGRLKAVEGSGVVGKDTEALVEEYKSTIAKIKSFESNEGAVNELKGNSVAVAGEAKSLGAHFVKHFGPELARVKGRDNFSVNGPEFKGAEDWHLTWDSLIGFDTDYDKAAHYAQPPLYVGDLFAQGNTSSAAVAWLEDSAVEGDAGPTLQGAKKNNIHFVNPRTNIEALKKITGILAFSDEMLEDHAWLASHVNQRGVYRIAVAEENQILNGSGQNGQLQGVLTKSGILTRDVDKTGSTAEFGEAILGGAMDVLQESGFPADAIVINPSDYAAQRLAKDSNGQYFGGGAFTGAYGNGQVQAVPSLWGLNTVISPRIPQGTALVGAFKAGGMLVRKGGVRIEATNSHADLFVSDVTVVRMEIRELLTVTQPKAFCKVSRKA